jgi:3-phosphoshikimate 1-carboxyvinyltransferase
MRIADGGAGKAELIAMACAVAVLAADGDCTIDNADAASVSYPEFYDTLRNITH